MKPLTSQHRARKRFGQNFLHDQNIIQRIVRAINPREGENVVEIGPGLGALTREILPLVGELDVVELDRDLIPKLQFNCLNRGKLQIHQADVLKFDFASLEKSALRVVGNLPYNISTPLIFHLLEQLELIADMHFMLQKEVVERLAAEVGTNDYGRLSVMVQYFCAVENLLTVPPEAFKPAPKVTSAIVRLTPHPRIPFPANNFEHFAEIVRAAFNQRRKTIRNSLKPFITAEQLETLGIDPTTRPERLSVEQFVMMSNLLVPVSHSPSVP